MHSGKNKGSGDVCNSGTTCHLPEAGWYQFGVEGQDLMCKIIWDTPEAALLQACALAYARVNKEQHHPGTPPSTNTVD